MQITNRSDISLEMAVWLLHDDYDYIDKENYISATSLMKPLRHVLLPPRIPVEDRQIEDVEDFIARALGNTLHAGIEKAWKDGNHVRALKLLGIPLEVIQKVLINPTPEELAAVEHPIPVYIEQRAFRDLDGYTIGGKFDMVAQGRVTDTKSTSAWVWLKTDRDEDYRIQGSIYRWLNPEKITEDFIRINFIFTDWQRGMSLSNPDYPPRRVMHRDIKLMGLEETEQWIRGRLAQITKHRSTPEAQLPECTDAELWMSDPVFKYYADPTKANLPGTRSSKNFKVEDFDNNPVAAKQAANLHLMEKGKGKGIVVEVPGAPKRCDYCPAYPICTQREKYAHD